MKLQNEMFVKIDVNGGPFRLVNETGSPCFLSFGDPDSFTSLQVVQTSIWLNMDLPYFTVEIRTGFGVPKPFTTRHRDRITVPYFMPHGYGGQP